jgi:hypothetical protein
MNCGRYWSGMAKIPERNLAAGCLALLLLAGGAWYLTRDSRASERQDRAKAVREECIRAGRAAWRARHRAEMSREQAADLVAGCFREAQR